MKKLPLLIFCLILFFSGCAYADKKPVDKFKADFSANCNDIVLKGKIYSGSNGIMTLSLKSPEALSGYIYEYKNDKLSISYDNMNIKSETGYLPESDFSKILFNVLKSIKNEENYRLNDNYNSILEYKGRCVSGKFILKTDVKSGFIKEISLKENKLTVKLNNHRQIK